MSTIGLARKSAEAVGALYKYSTLAPRRRPGDSILLEVNKAVNFRTVRELLIFFESAKHSVYLAAHLGRWSLAAARSLRWHTNTTLLWSGFTSPQAHVVCTDNPNRSFDKLRGCQKLICLRYDYGPRLRLPPRHFAMPLVMHPQIYVQYRGHERLESYRSAPRKIRMAFAGHLDKGYQSSSVREQFGRLTRLEVLDFLKNEGLIRVVSSARELRAALNGPYRHEFLVVTHPLRIDQGEWLQFLSQVDFLLCPPGILFPWCHNAVEAMAVGTIPLTNYPDCFFPSLVHGENCVAFSSYGDLQRGVMEVLNMGEDVVTGMRKNVIEYYDRHLSLARAAARILDSPWETVCLHIEDEREESVPAMVGH